MDIIVFSLDGERFAIPVLAVREVVRAVAIARLPGAPQAIEGVIDFRGTLVPVFDLRRRFHFRRRPLAPGEKLVIARAGSLLVGFRADAVLGVEAVRQESILSAPAIVPDVGLIVGIARLPDGLVLIHDLAAFLSDSEVQVVGAALSAARAAKSA